MKKIAEFIHTIFEETAYAFAMSNAGSRGDYELVKALEKKGF